MLDPHLKAALRPAVKRLWSVQLGWRLALSWTTMALVAMALVGLKYQGWVIPPRVITALGLVALLAVLVIAQHLRRREPNYRALARRIESRFPRLEGLLLTAVQQPDPGAAPRPYLEERLIRETLARAITQHWKRAIAPWRLLLAHGVHALAVAGFLAALWMLQQPVPPRPAFAARTALPPSGFSIVPGDTRIERGSPLVVLARLGRSTFQSVELVIHESGASVRRLPMTRSLDDPLYGGRVPEVLQALTYRVEYDGRQSRDYRVSVYEHPRLDRADAALSYPAYTGQEPRRIEDTRRVTAVEGSLLDLTLQLNKPVASARLQPRKADVPALVLQVDTNRPLARLPQFPLVASATYDLLLVDAEGLTNKVPAQFTLDALPNRTPELRLTAPRGDLSPSPLEEITFAGTAWDDFGLLAFGLAYSIGGQDPQFLTVGAQVPAQEKRPFQHLLRLEDLRVEPDQLVTWFTWADDLGPTGAVRRTLGDLYFAEVRPFDEVFREAPDQGSENSGEGEQGGGGEEGSPGRLAEVQKQIVSATWKLQRDPAASVPRLSRTNAPAAATADGDAPAGYEANVAVVRDAQAQLLEQAETLRDEVQDPQAASLWNTAVQEMTRALQQLNTALDSPPALAQALPPERAAYQALLRLQQREFAVAQRQSRNRGQNAGRNASRQRQLDQLELTQSENRYETEREARAPQSDERREQLQTLNRLQELARRQQDVNQQLRELQSALQEARTEAEREELRRQLQRLEDEQREMVADIDELRQRLDQPDSQSRTTEQRRRLEDTREDLQRAAEATAEGNPSQALAAGTRAERQLQDLRDELRRDTSVAFAEDLRNLRTQARELSREQQDINDRLNALTGPQRRTLGDSEEREALLEKLEPQKERLQELVDQTTEVSRQTEISEPLVSRELYDALRQFNQTESSTARQFQDELLERGLMTRRLYESLTDTSGTNATRTLALTEELLRQGQLPSARRSEERARTGIGQLTRGVERAAERVLGDDTEALRRARQELDSLARQLEREAAATEPTAPAPRGEPSPSGERETAAAEAAPAPQPGPADATSAAPGDRNEGTEPAGTGQGRAGDQAAQERERGTAREGRPADAAGEPAQLFENLLAGTGPGGTGPITGPEYASWSDRLRDVEEMVEIPELRADMAAARERARQLRLDYRRSRQKPDWAVVRLQVLKPLVEVRDRILEELARREPDHPLVPIDRDPVPGRYSELVRRYYEELGKDSGASTPAPRVPDARAPVPQNPGGRR